MTRGVVSLHRKGPGRREIILPGGTERGPVTILSARGRKSSLKTRENPVVLLKMGVMPGRIPRQILRTSIDMNIQRPGTLLLPQ